jgi:hypothetical protein
VLGHKYPHFEALYSLHQWFGAGGFLFPILVWVLSAVGAYFAAGETLFEYGDLVSLAMVGALVVHLRRKNAIGHKEAEEKRTQRNEYLPTVLEEIQTTAIPAPPDSERELTLDQLRDVQYAIDQARLGLNDWTNHTYIDQFQTASLRYQLYEILYCLGAYQGIYCPNFHGYLNEGFQNVIAKALTKPVNGFWKWESLWGKFTTNYDPVIRDNIMVTGFFQQGLMLYIANTGDMRYTKPGSLKFDITDKISYHHDVHSVDKALVDQWKNNPYCLFPCEPNWTYTPCNFQGMTGQVIYDRVFGTTHAEDLKPRFLESLMSNFADKSGSIIPIRSSMTGFTIPGLTGALIDLTNGILTRGYLPELAQQSWAIFKGECLQYDEATQEMSFIGLGGADNMDAGNYETSEHAIYPHVAYVAAEFGDEKIRLAGLKYINEHVGLETTSTGARRAKKGSFLYNMARVKAVLLRHNDWMNLIRKVCSAHLLSDLDRANGPSGPLQDNARRPYPILGALSGGSGCESSIAYWTGSRSCSVSFCRFRILHAGN